MNFDSAIQSHASWKMKLTNYLSSPDGSIQADELEKDDQCELGKWIQSESANLGGESTFQELKQLHSAFHKVAAGLVRRADAGENVSAEVALGGESEYSQQSMRIVSLILEMSHKIPERA